MSKSRLNKNTSIFIMLAVFIFPAFLFAQGADEGSSSDKASLYQSDKLALRDEENFTELQKMARSYRNQGVEAQRRGDIVTAMAFYRKAVAMDSGYAAPYNDLGVLLEASGNTDEAESAYLKCVQIDPDFLSAYTNLALLYEGKRDLKKAAYYWEKRARLGQPDDPWTQKAKQRLADMNLLLSNTPVRDLREQEVLSLSKEVANRKEALAAGMDEKTMSRERFANAKRLYAKGDLAGAFKEALDAQYLDPNNEEIEIFIEKVQATALSR